MGQTPKYTDQQKADAIETYRTHGPGEAARQLGCAPITVTRWAQRAGVVTEAAQNMDAANTVLAAQNALKRAKLSANLLEKALKLLDVVDDDMLLQKSNTSQVATALGILIDKLRLEEGSATERVETLEISLIDREIARLEAELGASDG